MSTVASSGTANTVVWFTSLRQGEQGVTRRILEELLPLLAAHGIHHEIVEPASAAGLLAALDDLAARVGVTASVPSSTSTCTDRLRTA